MVNSLLTDEQKKFVDDIVGYMSTDMSELGNEASMKAYGIKMYKESYYFPFRMWDGIKARASNDSGSAAAANDRAFHPSFSKTRLHGASNALMLINRRFATSGVYSLYTRPGKRLVIDAHGSDWDEVVVFDTNYPIDIAGYFNIKDSYGDDVFTTRQIAEFARSKGYDSVEIKNVYDDGMMNDNLDRGRKGKLKGDIAIFFNPNDVKSADTITYDDDGSIIPPSERFSDDSNDLRFSIRQGDMEINRWMQGLTASSLQTEQERTMLKQWQETMGSLNMARHALYDYKSELRKLEEKPTLRTSWKTDG